MTVASQTSTTILPTRSVEAKSEPLENVRAETYKYSHRDPASGSDLTTKPGSIDLESTSSTSRTSWNQWWRRQFDRSQEAISGFHKWEGRVVDVDDAIFTAEISSLDAGDDPAPVYADFEKDLLKPDVVEVGDIVYVTARMVDPGRGFSPSKTLSVRLRRIGNWTESEVSAIAEKAHKSWLELQDLID